MIVKKIRTGISHSSEKKALIVIQTGFILFFAMVYIVNGYFPSIEAMIALVVLVFLWRADSRKLLVNLTSFLVLLLAYQSLRGIADDLTPMQIHVNELIEMEKRLCGGYILSYILQNRLYAQANSWPITILANVFYMSHFVVPIVTAVIFWYRSRLYFWPFLISLILLSYIGFIFYLLYPAAPPWWATKYGYLSDQPVTLEPVAYVGLIEMANPNPVAAMPSLHMAYPVIIALWFMKAFGKKASVGFLLPLFVGFSAVYLGHHYVVDLIAGAVFSILIFLITVYFTTKKGSKIDEPSV